MSIEFPEQPRRIGNFYVSFISISGTLVLSYNCIRELNQHHINSLISNLNHHFKDSGYKCEIRENSETYNLIVEVPIVGRPSISVHSVGVDVGQEFLDTYINLETKDERKKFKKFLNEIEKCLYKLEVI